MRDVPEGRLADWVSRRFPGGTSPQWWLSIFESLEVSAAPFREISPDRRIRDLNLAAEAIVLAVEIDGTRAAIGAYWMLRIATLVMRFDPPISGLPHILTPDGSAEWALRKIPITRERAIAESDRREVEHLNAGEGFYAPVGGDVTLADEVTFSELQDVELILSALTWVFSHVKEKGIQREVYAWIEIQGSL
ncbi:MULTISPECIES: hypothetical protein [unclassified Streptomyces]|uniref:hypothetical protein n=1 Tax=unclassified Streptomyces TaxID=2593676 RepID=UPI00114D0AF3|nr:MULTISPECIES: hypothetical protein [unclassified Streptomyces]MYR92325.1 hypothetical protein [Streptomyces sp. SID4937]